MEETQPASRVDKFRQWVRNLAGGIFSAPYLPFILTVFYIVTVLTHLAIILMSQPLSYWTKPENAVGRGIFGETLSLGAGALIAVALVYLVIGTLLLSFVYYRWSLVGWFVAEFVHFALIQETLGTCTISRWSTLFNQVCQLADYDIFWVAAAIAVGLLLIFTFQPAEFPIESRKIKTGINWASGLLPAVWIVVMLAGVMLSVQKPTYGWTPVEVKDGPDVLREAESAYDTQRNRLVMFGGSAGYLGNDKWNYKTDT